MKTIETTSTTSTTTETISAANKREKAAALAYAAQVAAARAAYQAAETARLEGMTEEQRRAHAAAEHIAAALEKAAARAALEEKAEQAAAAARVAALNTPAQVAARKAALDKAARESAFMRAHYAAAETARIESVKAEQAAAAPVVSFVAVYVDDDGEIARRAPISAATIAAAYQAAALDMKDGEQLKSVYYDDGTPAGTMRAAAAVVVARLKNQVKRTGNPLQWRLYMDSRRGADECGPDIADLRAVAALALEIARADGEPIEGRYIAALNAVNRYMKHDMRAVMQTKEGMKTEYLEDVDGEIIATNAAIKQVFERGRSYYYDNDDETGLTDEKRAALYAIAAACSPTQRAIIAAIAGGASVRQIAAARGVSHVAVVKTMNRVRENARKLYPDLWAAYHDGAHYSRREITDIIDTLFKNEL